MTSGCDYAYTTAMQMRLGWLLMLLFFLLRKACASTLPERRHRSSPSDSSDVRVP